LAFTSSVSKVGVSCGVSAMSVLLSMRSDNRRARLGFRQGASNGSRLARDRGRKV
jgi:hypothetical protein